MSKKIRLTLVLAILASLVLVVLGGVVVSQGQFATKTVHDQLAREQIYIPKDAKSGLLPGMEKYAGRQVVTGDEAEVYADKFIAVHIKKATGGLTYAQVGTALKAATAAGDTKKVTELTAAKATAFQGEMLRGTLLNAYGWDSFGQRVTLAGRILLDTGIALGLLGLLGFVVPVVRRRRS